MDNNEAPRISLRSLSSLFTETWGVYRERWATLVEIVLLPTLVVLLGAVLIGLGLGLFSAIVGGLIVFAGWIIFMFSVLPIVYSIHNGTGVDASYKATIGSFWPFVWVIILQVCAVMGGYVMLIIPGIWLAISLSFVTYVFVVEHRRGIDALRQSKDYIKGYWWAVLGRIFLLIVVYLAVVVIVRIPVTFLAGQIVGGIVSAVIVLFFIPFAMIYEYAIFKNLRELKPHLAETQTKAGTGFLKASAIVGIVVPVLAIILAVIFAGIGAFSAPGRMYQYGSPPAYSGDYNY